MEPRFNHVGVHVKDMDKSVKFLEAVLGETAKTIRVTDDVALVGTKEGVFFDLIGADWGEAPKNAPRYGVIHYCLGVEDVDAAYARALEAGGEEKLAPVMTRFGCKVAFVYDPNGDVCEFIDHEWPDHAQAWVDAGNTWD
jgi:catechol 2,3-dioxygenase-like lactoylglutathione lyase family enzyme